MKPGVWCRALVSFAAIAALPSFAADPPAPSAKASSPSEAATATAAPELPPFKVKFETTRGDFVVEVRPAWAPIGAARLKELIEAKFYDECRFFRAVPNFVVQWGVNGDPQLNAQWRSRRIADDPVKEQNKRGTLTFATPGANGRTTHLFVNLRNNNQLDKMGFAPVGLVVEGMDVVDRLFNGYGDGPPYGSGPDQTRLVSEGNSYLTKYFAKLDTIKTARLLP